MTANIVVEHSADQHSKAKETGQGSKAALFGQMAADADLRAMLLAQPQIWMTRDGTEVLMATWMRGGVRGVEAVHSKRDGCLRWCDA